MDALSSSPMLPWWAAYFVGKGVARIAYGSPVWDHTSLVHNALSVLVGALSLWHWELGSAACASFSDAAALVIALQCIHSVSDFVVFAREMLEEPIFIAHHGVLVVVCVILPTCPGCMWTVWCMAVAEAGSASIAIDALWRRFGFFSRGRKRIVFFGGSRLVCLYFLYQIWLVTPSVTNFTVSSEGGASCPPPCPAAAQAERAARAVCVQRSCSQ